MLIHVAPSSGVPIYRQVIDQIKTAIACGALQTGDRLPPIRSLAERLAVNPSTIAKAYLLLEQDSVLESRRGAGVFVAAASDVLRKAERIRLLRIRVQALLVELHHLNLTADDLYSILEQCLETEEVGHR